MGDIFTSILKLFMGFLIGKGFLCLSDILIYFINSKFSDNNSRENLLLFKISIINKMDFTAIFIIITSHLIKLFTFKTMILMLLTYCTAIVLLKTFAPNKINITVDKLNNNLNIEYGNEYRKKTIEKEFKFLKLTLYPTMKELNDNVAIQPNISLEVCINDLSLENSYLNILDYNKCDKKLLSDIIQCKDINFKVKDKEFTKFDDAFIEMINEMTNKKINIIELNKEFVSKNKDELKNIYKTLNPNGNFENLNISY